MRRKFEQEAVKLTEGMPLTHVARDLVINPHVLLNWKNQLKTNPVNAFNGKGTPEHEKIKELEKQLFKMTRQRNILKKAVAIFSK